MNKKILFGIAALAIATVSVVNVNFNSQSNNLSDVSLANVEALAQELPPPPDTGYCCTHFPCKNCITKMTDLYEKKHINFMPYLFYLL